MRTGAAVSGFARRGRGVRPDGRRGRPAGIAGTVRGGRCAPAVPQTGQAVDAGGGSAAVGRDHGMAPGGPGRCTGRAEGSGPGRAGGVDSVAVRIAAARGAQVSATASAARAPLGRRLQAVPIDYTPVPVDRYVAEHPGGTGFDIVFDTVGGPALASSFETVRTCTGHAVSAPGREHPRARAAVVPGSPLLGRVHTAAESDGLGPPTPRRDPARNRQPGGRGRTATRAGRDPLHPHRRDGRPPDRGERHRRRQGRHRRGAANPARSAFPGRPLRSTRDPSGRTRPFPPGGRVCQRRGAAMDAR